MSLTGLLLTPLQVSYAHKLDPEADLAAAAAAAAAAKQCDSGDGAWAPAGSPEAEAAVQPDSPAVVEMTVVNTDNPAAAPAPAVPMLPLTAQNPAGAVEHAAAPPGPAARAEAGGASAASAAAPVAGPAAVAAAAAISAPSPGAAARVQQAMRQWYSRQGQADREAQEAARRQQLAWLRRPDDEPEPEVGFWVLRCGSSCCTIHPAAAGVDAAARQRAPAVPEALPSDHYAVGHAEDMICCHSRLSCSALQH